MPSISRDVVVTGANGFVGKNLRNFLHKKKINVLGVSRKNFRKHASEVKIISTNLLEPKLQTKLKNLRCFDTSNWYRKTIIKIYV